MRSRRWVTWAAIACMLMHAVTLVRHDLILIHAASVPPLNVSADDFDSAAICHGAGPAQDEGEGQKPPKKSPNGCPICLGVASTAALPASEAPALPAPLAFELASGSVYVQPAPAERFHLPSNRGPPSDA